MRLGDLIDYLAGCPTDYEVQIFGLGKPDAFESWRGVYAELTLVPAAEGRLDTVGKLLEAARKADGGTFEGYKGGDFTMSRDTPVWADGCGAWDCNGILSVELNRNSETVTLRTADISDYRGY